MKKLPVTEWEFQSVGLQVGVSVGVSVGDVVGVIVGSYWLGQLSSTVIDPLVLGW